MSDCPTFLGSTCSQVYLSKVNFCKVYWLEVYFFSVFLWSLSGLRIFTSLFKYLQNPNLSLPPQVEIAMILNLHPLVTRTHCTGRRGGGPYQLASLYHLVSTCIPVPSFFLICCVPQNWPESMFQAVSSTTLGYHEGICYSGTLKQNCDNVVKC